jgi:hypothetical protein
MGEIPVSRYSERWIREGAIDQILASYYRIGSWQDYIIKYDQTRKSNIYILLHVAVERPIVWMSDVCVCLGLLNEAIEPSGLE